MSNMDVNQSVENVQVKIFVELLTSLTQEIAAIKNEITALKKRLNKTDVNCRQRMRRFRDSFHKKADSPTNWIDEVYQQMSGEVSPLSMEQPVCLLGKRKRSLNGVEETEAITNSN
jgi:hypothetical protein